MALSHEQLNAFENLKWARDHEAPLSNRGFIKYKPELKTLRDVPEIEPAEGDFTFLAKGIDSLQECFNVRLNASVIEQFEKAKKQAVEDGHEISLEWNLPFLGRLPDVQRDTENRRRQILFAERQNRNFNFKHIRYLGRFRSLFIFRALAIRV